MNKRLHNLGTHLRKRLDENPLGSALTIIIFVAIVVAIASTFTAGGLRVVEFSESEFLEALESSEFSEVTVNPELRVVRGLGEDAEGAYEFSFVYLPAAEDDILSGLRTHAPFYETTPADLNNGAAARSLLTFLILGTFIFAFLRRAPGTRAPGIDNQKAAPVSAPDFKFDQLGGLDEAIVEVAEVVEFLSNPEKFTALGAKPPRGVLLEGPPGTGKTALARAAAGEASVPFFAMTASEFVEMYVGVGARRVRDLFRKAAQSAPAVVFIDEIDAVGRARGNSPSSSNDERESTLNQLLTEMDGFFSKETPVVVMAATNRSDILDPALLRRFTRHIHVGLPDVSGRRQILEIHLGSVTTSPDVDVESLSRRTVGFSGADLERLVNEAAVHAARLGSSEVTTDHLETAFDRIVLGLERRSAVTSQKDREIVAYHEAGHTLCAFLQPDADRPVKVSIIPRGPAGGVTHFAPPEAAFITRNRALASLRAMMGGRAAEMLLLGDDFTSGAAHDLSSASNLARQMVSKYGMGTVGPLFVDERTPVSPETARLIEEDVARIVSEALEDAIRMVTENRDALERLVEALFAEETLDAARIVEVLSPNPVTQTS